MLLIQLDSITSTQNLIIPLAVDSSNRKSIWKCLRKYSISGPQGWVENVVALNQFDRINKLSPLLLLIH